MMKPKTELMEDLEKTAKALMATTWDGCVNLVDIRAWREQFESAQETKDDEQLHAMYLLSHFLYFDHSAIRELLKSVFRDLYRSTTLHAIRRANADTTDQVLLRSEFEKVLEKTRFLGVGNPSESGVHLLYYFRQENSLPKGLFINSHEIFKRDSVNPGGSPIIRNPDVDQYIYIDDLCGSGTQAKAYSEDLVKPLKEARPNVKVHYFVLFATTEGLNAVRGLGCFDRVAAVFELDASFRCLEPGSRIFVPEVDPFFRDGIRETSLKYGRKLWPAHPLGFKDGQLLLGFSHNTPDNTLPIFWCNEQDSWTPLFKRYHKKDLGP